MHPRCMDRRKTLDKRCTRWSDSAVVVDARALGVAVVEDEGIGGSMRPMAGWQPIGLLITAGQLAPGGAAQSGRLPKADWMLADRGHDAGWFRKAPNDQAIGRFIPGLQSRSTPIKHDTSGCGCLNRTEILFGRLKGSRSVATRCDRGPKVDVSAIALAAAVLLWP